MSASPGTQRRQIAIMIGLIVVAGVFAGLDLLRRRTNDTPSDHGNSGAEHSESGETSVQSGSAVDTISWTPPAEGHYTGSASCAECHQEIWELYQTHPMSYSVMEATGLPPDAPDAGPVVRGITRQYRISVNDGHVVHTDEMYDADGEVIYTQAVPMDYIVGSGRRAHAYIYQEGDQLFQSPINWYSQAGEWDIAPGYLRDDARRFRRRVTDDCLSCHAGRVNFVGRGQSRFGTPPLHELSIGCENCHGPGGDHIAFRRSEERVTAADPIINPAKLDYAARESACNQCHMPGAARIPRLGRCDFDFRPGMDFEEIWTALEADSAVTADGKTRAVNHVEQMTSSRCSIESSGKMGCITCHDPHTVPSEETRVEWYRSRCLKCHQSDDCSAEASLRDSEQDSCFSCHMPRRDSSNISHVTQTDHRILKTDIDGDEPEESENTIQLRFVNNAQKRLPEWEWKRAMGIGLFSFLGKKGKRAPANLTELLQEPLNVHPDDGMLLSTMGALSTQLQRDDIAVKYLEKAAEDPVSRESSLTGLLQIHYARADWERSMQLVDQCIELQPGDAGLHAIRADILLNRGKVEDAVDAAKRSLELDPSRAAVLDWLANVYRKAGRADEAEAAAKRLDRMLHARLPAE
ncbi:MAG: hypothetical protein KDA96_04755 [Planctomycetaceae bacterium]|nr:hypothetical protein [Planctomycetaceae bacterium]